jgi:hypothetical protein
MTTVRFSCDITTTDAEAPLGLEAWIDNTKFFDSDHVQGPRLIDTDIVDDNSEHQLRLVMKNKTSEHTRINAAGEIVADARLIVSNIKFNDIKLGHTALMKITYTHNTNGTAELTQHRFYGEIGCNGTLELEFSTPIYLWLLEHM